MVPAWNAIRDKAISFSKSWAQAKSEQAERQTFWDQFFAVFGVNRRTVASFEAPVRNFSGNWGHIDLFWKGVLLVEHKSRGKPLDKAHCQAIDYVQALVSEKRYSEVPRYVIVTDFETIALHDLEDEQASISFGLSELHKYIREFGFIAGYRSIKLRAPEDPINVKAVELMGKFHDALEDGGYAGHKLERFLVRILFCLFAEDTGIFERNAFTECIINHTREDGSDLGAFLAQMFDVLNTPEDNRQKHLLEELNALPYVNGKLFAENLGFASLNTEMRQKLLQCCNLDWSRISPAVFGSLFQSVMDPRERRQVGAHYTSERDILKLINALFMDELWHQFASIRKIKNSKQREQLLHEFHDHLASLKFLDPACGCGNFLVVTYREIRLLELEVIKLLMWEGEDEFVVEDDSSADADSPVRKKRNKLFAIDYLARIDVDAMYGIEINEFPALIAEVAMWLIDHQMNLEYSIVFGGYFRRLPLKKSATIAHANALRIDWASVIKPSECSFLIGNPPFVGKKEQTSPQKQDVAVVWQGVNGIGNLDYVCCWYKLAADYTRNALIKSAFVSTNSICQGEQAAILWGYLFSQGIQIHFAHQTFAWKSEARGRAKVHVVIVGFSHSSCKQKNLFVYDDIRGDPTTLPAKNINAYLVDGVNVVVNSRSRPINGGPEMNYGSMMIDKPRTADDDQGLVFSEHVKNEILDDCPELKPYIRVIYGGVEYINNQPKWCLWLCDAAPDLLRKSQLVKDRLAKVKAFREGSNRPQTNRLSTTPHLFGEIRQPKNRYLLVPKVSSESRMYIPIGFVDPLIIASGSALVIDNAKLYHFGVLTSSLHNAWMRTVCGRMKSDYQYSVTLVYNNFPWPASPTDEQVAVIESKSHAVLDARSHYPDATLADLYDPLTMPRDLLKAHQQLDRAVEKCYRAKAFNSDRERVAFLLEIYQAIALPLQAGENEPKKTRKKKSE